VLLASTSDIRGFCAKRFEHITHADESTTVLCRPCASMFEADLCYLHAARELLPQARPSILDQWRCWFLAFDLHQGRWSACSPDDPSPAAKHRTVIGPMRDRHAASKLGELVDTAFDLCRYPAELSRAPHGRACAYFEMGRCPAPCDGHEPMGRFLERFAGAVRSLASLDELVAAVKRRVAEAASETDFERAADLQAVVKTLEGPDRRRLEHIGPIELWSRIAVVPQARCQDDAKAAIFAVRADGIHPLGPLSSHPKPDELGAVLARIDEATSSPIVLPCSREGVEELFMACRRLFRKRRSETFLTRSQALDPDTLLMHVRRSPGGDDEPDTETRTDTP